MEGVSLVAVHTLPETALTSQREKVKERKAKEERAKVRAKVRRGKAKEIRAKEREVGFPTNPSGKRTTLAAGFSRASGTSGIQARSQVTGTAKQEEEARAHME